MQRFFRGGFRSYTLILCVFYLWVVFLFHSSLQPSQPRGISDHAHDDDLDLKENKVKVKDKNDDAPVFPPTRPRLVLKDPGKAENVKPAAEIKHGDIVNKFEKHDVVMNLAPGESKGQGQVEHMNQDNIKAPPPKIDTPKSNGAVSPPLPCTGTDMEENQQFIEVAPDIRIFSVYWDERPNDFDNLNRGYYIRMMAVVQTRAAHMKRSVYCIFSEGEKTIPVAATYYEMCENHNRPYGGYILSCVVPAEIKKQPCTILVSSGPQPEQGQQFKVVSTVAREQRRDFAVCVSPLFGDLDPMKLVEWLELTQILGAQHINFYHYDLRVADPVIKKILEYYIDRGFLSVIDWRLDLPQETSIWYHGQLVAIQDCLYRNMATARYVASNDLDEFMVPHTHGNWSAFMAAADDAETCGFQMQSAFFDPARQSPEEGVALSPPEYARFFTLSDTRRSSMTSRVRTKCLIKPQRVFEAGIHHISKPIYANLHSQRIDLPVAVLHHYRSCMANYGMDCSRFQDDRVIPSRYGPSLVPTVHAVLKTLRSELVKYTFDSGFKQLLQNLK